jgi:hypothetical protein
MTRMLTAAIILVLVLAVPAYLCGLNIRWYREGHRSRFLPWV